MARKSRIDAPGALNHIIVRGIERRSIFFDGRDYQGFLERLGTVLSDSGYFEIKSDAIKSQSWRRAVARIRAIMGFSGADGARELKLTPSAVSKLVLHARNDPTIEDAVNDVLIFFNTPCLRQNGNYVNFFSSSPFLRPLFSPLNMPANQFGHRFSSRMRNRISGLHWLKTVLTR